MIQPLPGIPLLGNLLEFRKDRILLLERLRAECGDAGSFRLGPSRVNVFSSAELAREVLIEKVDAFEKGPTVRRFARPILGNGLIASDNSTNRLQRKEVSEAFQTQHYRYYAAQIRQASLDAAERWQSHGNDGLAIDLEAEMLKLSLDIIGKTLFSVDLLDQASSLSQAVAEILRHLTSRIQNPLKFGLGGSRAALKLLNTTIARMIEARRASQAPPPDLLTSLVRLKLNNTEIRDALMNLFIAGHETSGTSLAWTWYLLASHPSAYASLNAEVATRLDGAAVDFDNAGQLTTTLQIIKESMRLYPPVHSLGRQARSPVVIGGHQLKRGALVVVSSYLLHRRGDYFSEPLAFKPERFERQAEELLPKNAYLPFGLGARACIGKQFALLQSQIVLATLCRLVRFEVPANLRVRPEMLITLRPQHGIPARVRSLKPGGP